MSTLSVADDSYYSGPFTGDSLGRIRDFAIAFLHSYPYTAAFAPDLVAATLAQGAANHYAVANGLARRHADPSRAGVKDVDVWFFFRRARGRTGFNPRWLQSRDLGPSALGRNPSEPEYTGRRVDFLGRSIEMRQGEPPEEGIRRWLRRGAGSPAELAKKAIIGLAPESVFGVSVWVNPRLVK